MNTPRIFIPIRAIAVLAFCFSLAKAGVIVSHGGNVNPTTASWLEIGPGPGISTGGVSDDLGSGTDGWFVEDGSIVNGSFIHYYQDVTPTQIAQASAQGWTLSINLRVVTGTVGIFDGIFGAYSDGTSYYYMTFDREADGDPTVSLFGYGSYTLEGVGDAVYNQYDLVYDPLVGSADLFVNGVERISDYTGDPNTTTRVSWGAAGSHATGRGHFSSVEFSVVPEPTSFLLAALSCAVFSVRRRRG